MFGTCQRKQREREQLMQRLVYKQQTHKGSFPWKLQLWTTKPFLHTQTEQKALQHKVYFSPQWPHTETENSSFWGTYEWPWSKETCWIYIEILESIYEICFGFMLLLLALCFYIFWHQSGMNLAHTNEKLYQQALASFSAWLTGAC